MAKKRIPLRRKPLKPLSEYIILVGGPSNVFNGFIYLDTNDNFKSPVPPSNASASEILKYIQGRGLTDMPSMPDGSPRRPWTHDRYWANFLYAAVKLVECGHVQPQPGDILTFMVYYPAYEKRARIDWDASPYNLIHRPSGWVANKFPYNRCEKANQKGQQVPSSNPAFSRSPSQIHPAPPSSGEADINLEILLRIISDVDANCKPRFDGGYPIYAVSPRQYIERLHDLPLRLGGGETWTGRNPSFAPLQSMLIKLLLLTDEDPQVTILQLVNYIGMGVWPGDYWQHFITMDPEEQGSSVSPPDANWFSWPSREMTASMPPGHSFVLWKDNPYIDRDKIKIKEFHYVGHSDSESFYLQYGWKNPKGTLPGPDLEVPYNLIEAALNNQPNPFASDSKAWLWGCNLGGRMAPSLHKYVPTVTACESTTDFDPILNGYCSMPVPTTVWKTLHR